MVRLTAPHSSDDFVTIGKFMAPTEAQVAKGILEAAGISCFLQSENANNMLALASRARLKVRAEDMEAAVSLLEASQTQLEHPPAKFDA